MPRRRAERNSHDHPPGLAAPKLVGRALEMQRLADALARATKGLGSTLFLTGEAGIGKTRLALEALAIARTRGFRVVRGRAYPIEDGLAYATFTGAFGPLLRNLDPARQLSLVSGLPDLGRLFGGLRLPPPEPLGEPAFEKTRLFEAVTCLIERLARESPLVVFLDDLHLVDPASLELFHYVARSLAEQRVLLLVTCTTPQLNLTRGLRPMLRSLERARLAEEMPVSRLSAEDITSMVRALLGDEPPSALLDLLAARAGGTPLYIEALVRGFVDSGQLARQSDGWALRPSAADSLPASVRELVAQRLERLEELERRVLDVIAVIGAPASHRLVQAASGIDHDLLLGALRRLQSFGITDEETVGVDVTYRLTHPLVQEVAYASLPEIARRRLHAAVVDALEPLLPEDPAHSPATSPSIHGQTLGQLARHYRGAGSEADQSRALEILLAAGERAREGYANDEAARYLGAALALVRAGHRPRRERGHAGPLFPLLLQWLGEVWERVGELGAAVAVWSEALAEYERLGDVLAATRLRRVLALAEWDRGHFDLAQAHLGAGLAALAARDPSPELAALCLVRITVLTRVGQADRAMAEAAELLALAKRLASPKAEAEAHFAMGSAFGERWEMSAARKHALLAWALAEAAGDPLLIHRAHDRVAVVALALGDLQLARQHADASLRLALRLRAPSLELSPRQWLAMADYFGGDWDATLRGLSEALALARRVGNARIAGAFLGQRALVLCWRGELTEAEATVTEMRAAIGSGPPVDRHSFGSLPLVEAALAHERGHDERAIAIAAPLFKPAVPVASAGLPPLAVPCLLVILAEAQAAVGQPENALATARILADLDTTTGEGQPATSRETNELSYSRALAAYAAGVAHRALGETDRALDCLDEATRALEALAIPFDLARARLAWATLASSAKPSLRQPAVDAATHSLAVFQRLGARRYAQRARQLCHRLGFRPPAARQARPAGGLLSARELEVARLVVDGLTAPAIAERLCISHHTATTHLRRIYARLGINSRPALARYVIEAGLLEPQN